jgi:hypothetical protein
MATPRELSTGGGCVFGCIATFNEVPVGLTLSLSFSYDEKTGDITSANIQAQIDPNAAFIGPNPPTQRVAAIPLPGFTPRAEIFGVRIDSSVLRQLTPQQLQALKNEASKGTDPVNRAIRDAVAAEQQRRAEQERKKQEEERRKKCQQEGNKDCAAT